MSSQKNQSKKQESKNIKAEQAKSDEQTVKVLYQKLGTRWYTFSVIDDEVYMAAIPPEFNPTEKFSE